MTRPSRPRQRRDADGVGVLISRSNNFSIGGNSSVGGSSGPSGAPPSTAGPHIHTYTGRVLNGGFDIPGKPMGDLILGAALVRVGEETSIFTVRLEGSTVLFDAADIEAVDGASATVSYLTAG